MSYLKLMSVGTLAAGMLFSGVARAQERYGGGYRDNYAYRDDYVYRQNMRHDGRVERLRAAIASDRYRLEEDRRRGRHWAAERDARDLARHQSELDRRLRDLRWDGR
jgi:hypothetical protein